tara:strand:- start:5173 stop:5397 length:225 start_codon:yes stop_codon:yes gene_type:complete
MLIPVKGQQGLYRDSFTNAIVNKNTNEYQSYVTNRQKLNSDQERINAIEDQVNDVKNDLSEIKSLLKEIVNGSR